MAIATSSIDGRNRQQFEHPAFLYSSLEDFLAFMVPYVLDGLERGDVVFVAARGDNIEALRSELGPDGAGALLADTEQWHPHTGTRLRAFHDLVSDELAAGASAVRLAGEPVWPETEAELTREWQRYESVLNYVLAPYPVSLVCLYDAARLHPSILETARCTHPVVREGSFDSPSADFEPPEWFLSHWNTPILPPPARAVRLDAVRDLRGARRFLSERGALADVDSDRTMDLCLAANEILTNGLIHGYGDVSLSTWIEDDRLLVQVEDSGAGIADPLAGYRPPKRGATGGYGLWIARQLVDLVQVDPGPPGARIRLHVRLA